MFFFMKTAYIFEIHSVKVTIFAYFGIRGLNENSSGDFLKIHLKGPKNCMFKQGVGARTFFSSGAFIKSAPAPLWLRS